MFWCWNAPFMPSVLTRNDMTSIAIGVSDVHGGALVSEWSTTSAGLMQLPPFSDIPEPIHGRQTVMIDGA